MYHSIGIPPFYLLVSAQPFLFYRIANRTKKTPSKKCWFPFRDLSTKNGTRCFVVNEMAIGQGERKNIYLLFFSASCSRKAQINFNELLLTVSIQMNMVKLWEQMLSIANEQLVVVFEAHEACISRIEFVFKWIFATLTSLAIKCSFETQFCDLSRSWSILIGRQAGDENARFSLHLYASASLTFHFRLPKYARVYFSQSRHLFTHFLRETKLIQKLPALIRYASPLPRIKIDLIDTDDKEDDLSVLFPLSFAAYVDLV